MLHIVLCEENCANCLIFCNWMKLLNYKWQQRDSNRKPLSSLTNTQRFSKTGQMIELCCEYLSVRCIWLYVIIMSRTSFRVNPHSIVCLNVKELLARSRRHIWRLSDSNVIRTDNHLVRKRTSLWNSYVTW